MFKYFPHTEQDIQAMLEKIGVNSLDDLFAEIPSHLKITQDLNLPNAMSEIEIRKHIRKLGNKNQEFISFLGAGSYDVYTPAVIGALTSRQEFLTSYTPYQPEISQGTLTYIFEFQSMICELTGMDVSNASVYDGATATAESMFMAISQTKRNKVLVSSTINPRTIEVLRTYAKYRNIEIEVIESENFETSKADLEKKLNDEVACVIVQNPNFFGSIEEFTGFKDLIEANKSLFIMNVDPSTLSVLKTPREYGADIACGDGQTLGIPYNFGGPYVGYMATTEKFIRKMPGRICGMTYDVDGRRGFALTLQAREQHIRREKANSNICSNQSLMALHTVIYMSLMGKRGLVDVAKRSFNNAHYLKESLINTNKFKDVNQNNFFKEFVLQTDLDIEKLNDYLMANGYLSGYDLSNLGPEYKGHIMFCATEARTKAEIDEFVKLIEVYSDV